MMEILLKLLNNISLPKNIVKPVYKDYPRELVTVTFKGQWLLYRGSNNINIEQFG